MCYRCEVCQAVCPPRQQRIVHVVERLVPRHGCRFMAHDEETTRREIAQEIPVCRVCHDLLRIMALEAVAIRRAGAGLLLGVAAANGASHPPLPPEPLRAKELPPELTPEQSRKRYEEPEVAVRRPAKPANGHQAARLIDAHRRKHGKL